MPPPPALLSRAGRAATSRGAAGTPASPSPRGVAPSPSSCSWVFRRVEACLAPPSPGSLTLVFQQDQAEGHLSATRPAPGGARPQGSSHRGGPHHCPRCLQDPAAGCPAPRPASLSSGGRARFSHRLCPLFCSAFFSLLPLQPQNNFLCVNRALLVRKQYRFRSEEERDINLAEGKFSFTV